MTIPRGVHPPWGHDAFPLCFRFPLLSTNFQALWKISKIIPFPEKNFRFSSAEISNDFFLVIDHKWRISPYFPNFWYISLCFAKIIISPLLSKIPPCFRKIHLLFTYFMCISFHPYFGHDVLVVLCRPVESQDGAREKIDDDWTDPSQPR